MKVASSGVKHSNLCFLPVDSWRGVVGLEVAQANVVNERLLRHDGHRVEDLVEAAQLQVDHCHLVLEVQWAVHDKQADCETERHARDVDAHVGAGLTQRMHRVESYS